MALTQPQLLAAVADRAELPKAEAKRVLDALEEAPRRIDAAYNLRKGTLSRVGRSAAGPRWR